MTKDIAIVLLLAAIGTACAVADPATVDSDADESVAESQALSSCNPVQYPSGTCNACTTGTADTTAARRANQIFRYILGASSLPSGLSSSAQTHINTIRNGVANETFLVSNPGSTAIAGCNQLVRVSARIIGATTSSGYTTLQNALDGMRTHVQGSYPTTLPSSQTTEGQLVIAYLTPGGGKNYSGTRTYASGASALYNGFELDPLVATLSANLAATTGATAAAVDTTGAAVTAYKWPATATTCTTSLAGLPCSTTGASAGTDLATYMVRNSLGKCSCK